MVVFDADAVRRRVIATVPAGTTWRAFHDQGLLQISERPALTDYDWIIDDQGPMEDVDVEGMAASGAAFLRLSKTPDRLTFTIVVTTDRFFPEWARVIDKHYGARRHHAAPTLKAAVALLETLDRVRAEAA